MPPKQKKQPRNAYFFYMLKRKQELELEGHRFLGGMKDVAHAVGGEWAQLTPTEKAPFEEQARKSKEDGKHDLTNKYTSSGESYAQVQRRKQDDMEYADEQDNYISELGNGTGALDRVFVLIKTIHCVEQIVERNERIFWPIEIGMVAFTLREGLKSLYWTLVDTQKTPVGYASAAKECSEETGLPEPGMACMAEYRDYNKIMKHVQGFIKTWTKQGYRHGPVVFAMDVEVNHAVGCLRWIANHVDEDKRREHQMFIESLKFYKLPKLILRLAEYANQLDPHYSNILTTHKLEQSAASIVTKGCYDYKDEITCDPHKTEKGSLKMFTCCRNVCLRRMFLLFEEFLPAFGLEKTERHDMNKLREAQIAKARAALLARPLPPTVEMPPLPKEPEPVPWGKRRDVAMEEDPSPPSTTYKRLPPDPEPMRQHIQHTPVIPDMGDAFGAPTMGPGFVPWGRKPEAPEASFQDDDFPALGGPSKPMSNPSPPKKGLGRGRGAIQQDDYDDDAWDKSKGSYY